MPPHPVRQPACRGAWCWASARAGSRRGPSRRSPRRPRSGRRSAAARALATQRSARRRRSRCCARTSRQHPTDSDARVLLGIVLSWEGDYPAAREELEQVLAESARSRRRAAGADPRRALVRRARCAPRSSARNALLRHPDDTTLLYLHAQGAARAAARQRRARRPRTRAAHRPGRHAGTRPARRRSSTAGACGRRASTTRSISSTSSASPGTRSPSA